MRRYGAIFSLAFFLLTFILAVPAYAAVHMQSIGKDASGGSYFSYSDEDPQSPQKKSPAVYCGSGFFIMPDIIVTNNHVVHGASKIEVAYNDEVVLMAMVIGRDEVNDLALLKVSGLESVVTPLVLANSSGVREGNRVYAVGFPLPMVMGPRAKISEGIISSSNGLQGDLRMFQISTPVQPGNSGGPLLNDQAEVVGVVAAGLSATYMMKQGIIPQNVNYAIKANHIRSLITSSEVDDRLAAPKYGCSLSAADVMDIARKAVVLIKVIK
ncbi:MAG: trypsin-like peptidase domain-containing protein [Sporomusaceae bacterium]|nr:trypsin-like peptidase domain-containing protein [Sporomusaceae bacterium]